MKIRVLVPIADGSEEIESVTVVDILRRAGVDVFVSAVSSSNTREITASRGVKIVADDVISNSINEMWDAVVLPGGIDGAKHLAESKILDKILIKHISEKKVIAAICASPCTVLGDKGFLTNHIATCHPHFHSSLKCRELDAESRVVVDDHYITSQGPGTAIDFALEIVEMLCGVVKREEVASPLVLTTSTTSYY